MEEKIFEMLKTKYSNLGLSNDVLNGYAKYLAASVTEEAGIDAAVATIEPLLKMQQKEYDKIRAAQKKAEEVKKDNEKKDNEPIVKNEVIKNEKKEKEEKKNDEIPEWAKTLIKDFSSIKKDLSDRDHAEIISKRRAEVESITSKLPDSVKKAYSRMNLDVSDEDYEALKTSLTTEVEETMKEFNQKRSIFSPPYAGGGENDGNPISKKEADEIAKSVLHI